MPATPELNPLAQWYQADGSPLPVIEPIEPEDMPEPYRSLLVHTRDMTPTLEGHHQSRVHLRILRSLHNHSTYTREVVLVLDGTDKPVEFGAITIHLAAFAKETQKLILNGKRPLGAILAEGAIQHESRPQAFIRVEADATMKRALRLRGRPILYGRCNRLLDKRDRTLAAIVEILPPL